MFSNELELNWVVGSQATAGKTSVDLNPFEFAILDADTYTSLSPADAMTKSVLLAVGSPNAKQGTDGQKINRIFNPLNSDVSFKSETLGRVTDLRFFTPKKQDLKQVYYLGYNGIDACESLNFECGKTYDFHINAKGRIVRSIFGREFNEIVSVDTPCCDESCGCVNGKIDCSLVIDQLIERFKTDIFWVNRFFEVEKVMSCSPAVETPTKVNYTKYCLTVCDNGDELALAEIQNQYPTLKVTVKDRKAPYTTYEFTQLASASAPAAYSQQDTILKDCAACPSGYTAQASGYAYIVEIDNTNADTTANAQLTAVQTIWPTAISANKVNFSNGTSTYYVVSSAVLASVTGDARVFKFIGATSQSCLQTTPVTTSWVSCGAFYKVKRSLVLTKQNDDCKSNPEELALVTASLAGRADVVPGSLAVDAVSDTCIIRFNVEQYNNALLADGCDVYGYDGAKFDPLPAYMGFKWEVAPCEGWTTNEAGCPVPPVATDRCCQCGIKFTTLEWNDTFLEQIWDINEFDNIDPIDLQISLYTPDGSLAICSNNFPLFRKVKGASYRSLKGRDVIKQILLTRNDRRELFLNQTNKEGLLFLMRQGTKYGVKFDDYYYKIEIEHLRDTYKTFSPAGFRETISLYIHESDIALFQSLKGQLSGMFPTAKVTTVG